MSSAEGTAARFDPHHLGGLARMRQPWAEHAARDIVS
jgi:hypothetical protein